MSSLPAAPPDDQHLWSRARQGDPAAFGELFTRHSTVVYNHCFRLTGSWKIAEDLTSVVFLEAWRKRDDVVAEAGFVPWLLSLAGRVAGNSTRAVRRHRRLLAKLPPAVIAGGAADAAPRHDPADAAARADDERHMKQVLRVFRRLPKQEQEVLALCVWGERTYAEAAVALGIPVGTVRSRLARARAHMERLTEAAATKTAEPRPGSRPEGAHHT
ncbi:RNA polymerase sigma factor [Jiangella alkaliphila]|uniref:RNA polymerase sigma-70 factor, ECF subfamily n=1 Tax=Jiangella alkaliphila TaxID=419479 RepID=A0A1H2JCY9_9ACTN|nr:sigma-70 family RNA polymerase sigma factor [Jiangella alkaliphila]SDU54269.1 RNA polymerase sigma-70 factor, ECF subfamily [Jiangella alkaliphila]